jgi:hypothetical protein
MVEPDPINGGYGRYPRFTAVIGKNPFRSRVRGGSADEPVRASTYLAPLNSPTISVIRCAASSSAFKGKTTNGVPVTGCRSRRGSASRRAIQ